MSATSGLLYFVPGIATLPGLEAFVAERLRPHVGAGAITSCRVERGPDPESRGGSVFAIEGPQAPARVGYVPAAQEWHAAMDGACWIGWATAARPGPASLARAEQVDGHLVQLEDGATWLVPAARIFPTGTRLPESLVLGPGGRVVREIIPRFASIAATAQRVEEEFFGAAEGRERTAAMTDNEVFAAAVEALGVNYRLGAWEVSALRLLSTRSLRAVLLALIDGPTFVEAAKAHAGKAGGSAC